MIESPVLKRSLAEGIAETLREAILRFLQGRFGPLPEDIKEALRSIEDKSRLDELVDTAASCPDLEAFRARLRG